MSSWHRPGLLFKRFQRRAFGAPKVWWSFKILKTLWQGERVLPPRPNFLQAWLLSCFCRAILELSSCQLIYNDICICYLSGQGRMMKMLPGLTSIANAGDRWRVDKSDKSRLLAELAKGWRRTSNIVRQLFSFLSFAMSMLHVPKMESETLFTSISWKFNTLLQFWAWLWPIHVSQEKVLCCRPRRGTAFGGSNCQLFCSA